MTATRFTKEQLIAKLQHQLTVAAKYPDVEEAELDAAIFKIALASLDAGSNSHPAHGQLSNYRLQRIREILGKAAAQRDGGNLGYAMSDAVKAIDELLEVRKAEPVAFIGERMLEDVTDGARSCGRIWSDGTDEISGERRIPLYRHAQPAPVDNTFIPKIWTER